MYWSLNSSNIPNLHLFSSLEGLSIFMQSMDIGDCMISFYATNESEPQIIYADGIYVSGLTRKEHNIAAAG